MVHGTTYSVRYIIELNNEIDYYNDLLPICIENRKMFQIIRQHKKTVLIIFDTNDLHERFAKQSRQCIESLNHFEYDSSKEEFVKYWQAFMYSCYVKIVVNDTFQAQTIYSQEEINELQIKSNDLITKLSHNDDSMLRYQLKEIQYKIRINSVLNPNENQEIIQLETELSTIELTDEEQSLLHRVKLHPVLLNNIKAEGFQLFSYDW